MGSLSPEIESQELALGTYLSLSGRSTTHNTSSLETIVFSTTPKDAVSQDLWAAGVTVSIGTTVLQRVDFPRVTCTSKLEVSATKVRDERCVIGLIVNYNPSNISSDEARLAQLGQATQQR